MRFTQQEKYEIIQLVEGSDLGANRTLRELGIHKSTFYNWYGLSKGGRAMTALRPATAIGTGYLTGCVMRLWNRPWRLPSCPPESLHAE